jgi:hypothetical protein
MKDAFHDCLLSDLSLLSSHLSVVTVSTLSGFPADYLTHHIAQERHQSENAALAVIVDPHRDRDMLVIAMSVHTIRGTTPSIAAGAEPPVRSNTVLSV